MSNIFNFLGFDKMNFNWFILAINQHMNLFKNWRETIWFVFKLKFLSISREPYAPLLMIFGDWVGLGPKACMLNFGCGINWIKEMLHDFEKRKKKNQKQKLRSISWEPYAHLYALWSLGTGWLGTKVLALTVAKKKKKMFSWHCLRIIAVKR